MQFSKKIPLAEYRELAKGLTLENFDADSYAALAKAAGLKMCFYYSQALDWEDPDAFGNTWDFPEDQKVYRRFLDGKCKAQLKELLTEYSEIGLIWFDMPGGMTVEESLELKAYVKQFQPDCLVSGRINMDQTIGDYGCLGDNEFPSGKFSGAWETPATLNNAWGYRKSDLNWKSAGELLRLLIELLSKGMNYLLNVGPRPDGMIQEESAAILTEMGKWVFINSEAVYGTEATPYQFDFLWGRVAQKENCLYLYLPEPVKKLELPGIKNRVRGVSLLMESGKNELPFEVRKTGHGDILSIEIGESDNQYYDVIRVELLGEPDVEQGLYELPDGQIHLYSHMVVLNRSALENAGTAAVADAEDKTDPEDKIEADVAAEKNNVWMDSEFCIDINGNISNWFDTKNSAGWNFELYDAGTYEVLIQTRSAKYAAWTGGHLVAVRCEGEALTARLDEGEKVFNSHTRYFGERLTSLGTVELSEGQKHLDLYLLECNREEPDGLLVTKMILRKI